MILNRMIMRIIKIKTLMIKNSKKSSELQLRQQGASQIRDENLKIVLRIIKTVCKDTVYYNKTVQMQQEEI